ncbi:MAG: hypothetical protein ACI959_002113 [Limisphaerales bacterium]|jgi:hypothetical protein
MLRWNEAKSDFKLVLRKLKDNASITDVDKNTQLNSLQSQLIEIHPTQDQRSILRIPLSESPNRIFCN